MVSNLMLTYGGVTPAQALTGCQPRELYDPHNSSLAAVTGAMESTPDYIERSIRLRLHAKDSILQSVWEDRWTRAENTKVQQLLPEDLSKLVDGAKIDIWREPDQKGEPSWRGPAELLRLYRSDNKSDRSLERSSYCVALAIYTSSCRFRVALVLCLVFRIWRRNAGRG